MIGRNLEQVRRWVLTQYFQSLDPRHRVQSYLSSNIRILCSFCINDELCNWRFVVVSEIIESARRILALMQLSRVGNRL